MEKCVAPLRRLKNGSGKAVEDYPYPEVISTWMDMMQRVPLAKFSPIKKNSILMFVFPAWFHEMCGKKTGFFCRKGFNAKGRVFFVVCV